MKVKHVIKYFNDPELKFYELLREVWFCGKINELMIKKIKENKDCLTFKFYAPRDRFLAIRIINYYRDLGYDIMIWIEPKYTKIGIGWKE